MRLAQLLEYGSRELAEAGVPEYRLDARLLLENCLGITRTQVFLKAQSEVDDPSQQRFLAFIERRKKREPVAYILGEQEFWSLPFHVPPAVLIPRPETEFLLDRVLALALPANIDRGALLDLCCGSGVIATVLARETGKEVVASDISSAAFYIQTIACVNCQYSTIIKSNHSSCKIFNIKNILFRCFNGSITFFGF